MAKPLYIKFEAPQSTDAGRFALFITNLSDEFKSLLSNKESATFSMYHGGSHGFSFNADQEEALSVLSIFKEKFLQRNPNLSTHSLDLFTIELARDSYGSDGDSKRLDLNKFINNLMTAQWQELCRSSRTAHSDLVDTTILTKETISLFNGQTLFSYTDNERELNYHIYAENDKLCIACHDISMRKPILMGFDQYDSIDANEIIVDEWRKSFHYINQKFLLVYLSLLNSKQTEKSKAIDQSYYDFYQSYHCGELNKEKLNKNLLLKVQQ